MYFAQAEQTATDALGRLIDQGVVGAIAVLAILSLALVVRMLLLEKDKRIDDASKTRESVAVPLKEIQESIRRMEEKIIISKAQNHEGS